MDPTRSQGALELGHEDGRHVAVFRPRGAGRFASAGVLAVWLCGWVVGELFAAGALAATLGAWLAPDLLPEAARAAAPDGPGAGFVVAFLLVWLALWTLGGVLAVRELLRLVSSSDRIAWDGAGATLERRIGPLRSRRDFERAAVRAVRLLPRTHALALVVADRTVELTRLGSVGERTRVRDALREALGVAAAPAGRPGESAPPAGWEAGRDDAGHVVLARSRRERVRHACIAAFVALAVAALAAFAVRGALEARAPGPWVGAGVVAAIALLIGWGAGHLAFIRDEIALGRGWIEWRRRHGARERRVRVDSPRLEVTLSVDSDGDVSAQLRVHGGPRPRRVMSVMNDTATVIALAEWMAARTDAPLDLPPGLNDRAA